VNVKIASFRALNTCHETATEVALTPPPTADTGINKHIRIDPAESPEPTGSEAHHEPSDFPRKISEITAP
jgi:hypothetical protein